MSERAHPWELDAPVGPDTRVQLWIKGPVTLRALRKLRRMLDLYIEWAEEEAAEVEVRARISDGARLGLIGPAEEGSLE